MLAGMFHTTPANCNGHITMNAPDPEIFLRRLFDAAVEAADPARIVAAALPSRPAGRTIVVGAGKASAAMARAVELAWPDTAGDRPLEGLVITRYGHTVACDHIRIVEAGHPNPDAAGLAATQAMLSLLNNLNAEDLVIALISGGGSALTPAPGGDVTLADKQAVNAALLACGASIGEINTVRKHLSCIKGGRLAARAAPAHVVALLISDVPGDDPSVIASGPTVPDPTTRQQALAVLRRYGIAPPPAVLAWLLRSESESIKPGDPRLAGAETHIIATPRLSLAAAANLARAMGVTPVVLGDAIEGEAAEVGKMMAGIARYAAGPDTPFGRPCVLLSGGETTVTLRPPPDTKVLGTKPRGGRNVEFLLALGLQLNGAPGIHALAADTDGVDGTADIAGAVLTPDTLSRALDAGLDPRAFLDRHDGHGFFSTLGDSLITGPTLTNVNDFRAILIT